MPRPRTKREDIRNPEHYFNRYIALEIKHDRITQQEIDDNEVSLDEKLERGEIQLLLSVNQSDDMLLRVIIAKEADGWLELLENERLGSALRKLTSRQREIIRLYFFDDLKLSEIARVLGLSKSAVSQRFSGVMKILKNYFLTT